VRIIEWLRELFALQTTTKLASELGVTGHGSDLLARLCDAVDAQVYLSGPSGRDYLDLAPFRSRGIAAEYFLFAQPEYPRDGEPWIPDLSAVDLIAHVGVAQAREVLRDAVAASRREPADD
jgi:hypothetical protein